MIPRLVVGPPEEKKKEEDNEIRTRAGYKLPDVVKVLDRALAGTGVDSLGRLFHYTADLIASGGKDLWMRICFEHAIDHIGLASPKVFKYLRTRFREIEDVAGDLETESFYNNPVVQRITSETVYVLQQSKRSPKPKIQVTAPEMHRGPWLRASLRAGEMAIVRRVWQSGADAIELRNAGNELVYAINEGALERALFWMRWMFDEEAALKKEMKEMGIKTSAVSLTTVDRAGAGGKQKNYVAQYISVLCAEVYKDLAGKGLIKMHEEFQCILDLFKTPDTRISARRRNDLLILMIQILTEVPKWKNTAAGPLVADPVALQRAIEQVGRFYIEIMQYPALATSLPRAIRARATKKVKKGESSKLSMEEQESLYEEALNRYFDRR
jgi:hypothetical protein